MKRIEKIFLILLTVATIQAISVASANAQTVNELMMRLDVDQDGFISLKEAVSHTPLLKQFGLIDVNADGKISPDELEAGKAKLQDSEES